MLQGDSFEFSEGLSSNSSNQGSNETSNDIIINLSASILEEKQKTFRKNVRFNENIEVHLIESNMLQDQSTHYTRMKEQVSKMEVMKIQIHLNELIAQHEKKLQIELKQKETRLSPKLSENLCKCLIF